MRTCFFCVLSVLIHEIFNSIDDQGVMAHNESMWELFPNLGVVDFSGNPVSDNANRALLTMMEVSK